MHMQLRGNSDRAEINPHKSYQKSCQYRFSDVYLVFEVLKDTWHSNEENPSAYCEATLSCILKIAALQEELAWIQKTREGCRCFRGLFGRAAHVCGDPLLCYTAAKGRSLRNEQTCSN